MNKVVVGVLLLPAWLSASGGCAVLGRSPSQAYVASDRATYEAVAPEYAGYVNDDPGLDDSQRARRVRTLETWRLRIESAERASGAGDAVIPDSNGQSAPSRGGESRADFDELSRVVPVRPGPQVPELPEDRANPENSLEDAP